MRYILLILIFLPALCNNMASQDISLLFYNAGNLFDTVDDTLKNDDEFLSSGAMRWTSSRYRQKIDAVARVIMVSGGWEMPYIVGLCEVENRKVADDLARSDLLAKAGYSVIHRESPDPRGIDLCMLYRHDFVKVLASVAWVPEMKEGETFTSRNLLYVKAVIASDTLHIILCHWPSRRGGVMAAGPLRGKMALLLKEKTDSLLTATNNSEAVVIMGDFNTGPDDRLITLLTDDGSLVNLSRELSAHGRGSYRYKGQWEMIDQILVSQIMTSGKGSFYTDEKSFFIPEDDFMYEDDPDYPGKRPFATFRGYSWKGGYSDHLPVLVKIAVRSITVTQ